MNDFYPEFIGSDPNMLRQLAYLKKNGQGIIMVKARSIDVSIKPKIVYENVIKELKKYGLMIVDLIDISHYEKDHATIVVSV